MKALVDELKNKTGRRIDKAILSTAVPAMFIANQILALQSAALKLFGD